MICGKISLKDIFNKNGKNSTLMKLARFYFMK